MPFYENLGFVSHPFVKTNADEEPLLEKYFVPPPFFDGVIGDPTSPSPAIVLAPRGGGKSALRRQIEIWAPDHKVLAVTYDRFEFSDVQKLDDIGLPYHLRNIITRLLVAYLSYLQEDPVEISWTRKQLESVLCKRLKAFSDNKISSMTQLIDKNPVYPLDSILCLLANRSPRNLIRICESIFSVQADMDPNSNKITEIAVERGILKHAERVTSEQYGDEISKDLQRVGREAFTINYLSNDVFKTAHENTSRNKVTAWQKAGIVSQLGTVSLQEAKRPLNFYFVTDPAMIRLIHRNLPLTQFIKDHWLTCSHCDADNLINIELIPHGNELLCHACNRRLL